MILYVSKLSESWITIHVKHQTKFITFNITNISQVNGNLKYIYHHNSVRLYVQMLCSVTRC